MFFVILSVQTVWAGDFIILQSTTSTQNSGLFDFILPKFKDESGIEVRVVAVGTGQALRNAGNGDGDVLLVHSKTAEEQFVADGFGLARSDVMFNDFVLVGPLSDPASVSASKTIGEALNAIAESASRFASRGDDSGTHKAEMALWAGVGVKPAEWSGAWYSETGSGMGATLNLASGLGAYTLTDRATWLAFGNKGDLQILYEGDEQLFNQYGVILVDPDRHPHIKAVEAAVFVDWLLGQSGQAAINDFRVDGQQLFFANSK
jgi:tungstate transport system substrate-binding protein